MKNWKTIKDLLNATLWGVCVLLASAWKGRSISTEQFSGPFLTALGVDLHNSHSCPVIQVLNEMLT